MVNAQASDSRHYWPYRHYCLDADYIVFWLDPVQTLKSADSFFNNWEISCFHYKCIYLIFTKPGLQLPVLCPNRENVNINHHCYIADTININTIQKRQIYMSQSVVIDDWLIRTKYLWYHPLRGKVYFDIDVPKWKGSVSGRPNEKVGNISSLNSSAPFALVSTS